MTEPTRKFFNRQRLTWLLLALGTLLAAERLVSIAANASGAAEAPPPEAAAARPFAQTAQAAKPAQLAQPSLAVPGTPAASVDAPAADLLRLQRLALRDSATAAEPSADPFAAPLAAGRQRAAPAPQASAPEARPPVPAFSYAYVGSLLDDGERSVFFSRQDGVLRLRVGDNVDGQFRVDAIDAAQLALTHLASGERLVVNLAGRP